MEKFLIATGKTIDLAIQAALDQLSMDRDSVSVEVLENAKSGFLGIGAQPAKVKVSYEVPDEEPKPALSSASRSRAQEGGRARCAERTDAPNASIAPAALRSRSSRASSHPPRLRSRARNASRRAGSRPAPERRNDRPKTGSPRPRAQARRARGAEGVYSGGARLDGGKDRDSSSRACSSTWVLTLSRTR